MTGQCSACQGQGAMRRAIVIIRQFGVEKEVEIWFHDHCNAEDWARRCGKRFVKWVEKTW